MKIGIDASRYGHAKGTGVEWYSFNIINNLIESALKKKGVELILYTRDEINLEYKIGKIVKKHRSRVKVKTLKAKRFWTLWKLTREMKKNPPDALFVPSHVFPLSLPAKSYIMIHDVAFKYLRQSYSWFQYKYLDFTTKFAVKNATKIFVPSEATKDDLVSFYNCPEEKIVVVPHGFNVPQISDTKIEKAAKDSEVFKYFRITKKTPYILFVGRLESKKNLSRLVEAFKEFSLIRSEFKLVLAGKRGVGFDHIFKTVQRLNLVDKVIMPGYVTEEEKAALYKYCKIFAFPSLYEGFGFPVLEALYYKKPVLTSHVSCLPEVAGDAVYYVDPYDAQLILSGLERLLNDKKYTQTLARLGEKRVKMFSWKKAAKETLEVMLNG